MTLVKLVYYHHQLPVADHKEINCIVMPLYLAFPSVFWYTCNDRPQTRGMVRFVARFTEHHLPDFSRKPTNLTHTAISTLPSRPHRRLQGNPHTGPVMVSFTRRTHHKIRNIAQRQTRRTLHLLRHS